MNQAATSREEILTACREMLRRQGWESVNIRSVAEACGVSVGTIYHYFSSKDDMVGATVESVWHDIFHAGEDGLPFADTLSCIGWMYRRMACDAEQYPHFFSLHALRFDQGTKPQGKAQMQRTWEHIRQSLCAVMRQDPRVRPDAFQDGFSPETFAGVLFSLMLSAMLRQDYDPAPVQEITRRVLY